MRGTIAACAFVSGLTCLAAAQQPARDPRPMPPAGTSVLSGRVVTMDEPAAPVRRARVVVTSTNLIVTRSVMTADDGSFVVAGLPAGRYTVAASKPGMLRMSYGAVRPTRPGTPVSVAAGQKIDGLAIRMARGGVISGMVLDPHGRPARGVPVRVQEARTIAGERVVSTVTIAPGTSGETTDDRGEFRLFGLPPGDYIVGAVPADEGDGLTRTAGGGTVGYVPIYYPGTPVAAEARTVSVNAGEEVSGVSIQLQFVRTATVSGSVAAPPSIRPQDVVLSLMPKSASGTGGSYAAMISALTVRAFAGVAADWTFSYAGLAPGSYTIAARVVERGNTSSAAPSPGLVAVGAGTTRLWAAAEVIIDGVDRSGLVLTLQPGVTIAGRIEFQHAPSTSVPDLSRVRVSIESTSRADGIGFGGPAATPNAAGQFALRGVAPGLYRVRAYVNGDVAGTWSLMSSIVGGRDMLDFPAEVRLNEDLAGVVVTLTDATQRVSGLFQDASGRPATAFTVVLFPADPALRVVSRRIRTTRPGQDGRYTIDNIPAGDYRLAAVYDITAAEANDPALLESLVAASITISIRPGERKVQDLKISR